MTEEQFQETTAYPSAGQTPRGSMAPSPLNRGSRLLPADAALPPALTADQLFTELFGTIAQVCDTQNQIENRIYPVLSPEGEEQTEVAEKSDEPIRLTQRLIVAIRALNKLNQHMRKTLTRIEL